MSLLSALAVMGGIAMMAWGISNIVSLRHCSRVTRSTLILWVGGPWDGWWTPAITGNPDKVYVADAVSGHTYIARGVSDGDNTVLCYVHESELWDSARQAEILEWARRSGRCL